MVAGRALAKRRGTIPGVPDWVLWVILAALLAVGEVFTLGFFLGPIALAALVAAAVAAFGLGLELQVAAFAVGSIASLAIVRPIAKRHLRTPASLRTGTAALVGATAVVVERVDAEGGRVKIGGEVWSARSYDEDAVIDPGTRVSVLEIRGATALVSR
jgi:membrane protein implicated in regulation of membrane protease activity